MSATPTTASSHNGLPCPICSGVSATVGQLGVHEVWQCGNAACNHLFSAQLGHGQGVMVPQDSAHHNTEEFAQRNRVLIARWQRDGFLRSGNRVIDIGAGTGHIAQSLTEAGVPVVCVEAGDALRANLAVRGFTACANLRELPTGYHPDRALLIEVIEHVEHPVEVLREIRQALPGKGGKLFLTTPAGGCRQRDRIFRDARTYNNAQHLHFYTPTSLEYALRLAGFRRMHYRFMPEMVPGVAGCAEWRYHWRRFKQWGKYRLSGVRHLTLYADA